MSHDHEHEESKSDSEASELRSYVENVIKECDTFRILVCGKSGTGKSTLVSEVFDFERDRDSAISHFTSGNHDINKEITSELNKSLILHDSRGLETGSSDNLQTIRKFLAERRDAPLQEQVHAIWYCVQVPTAGERPFEAGDQALFRELQQTNKVPLIVVFTKFDRLQFELSLTLKQNLLAQGIDAPTARKRARIESLGMADREYQRTCVEVLASDIVAKAWTTYCKVSYKDHDSIVSLIQLTKSTLSGPQSQHLEMLWATAQKADLDLKVTTSVVAGKNMYWSGLAAGFIPLLGMRRITTLTILRLIHRDIVRIWNFSDPQKILNGANFRVFLRSLFVEPLVSQSLDPKSVATTSEQDRPLLGQITGLVFNPAEGAATLAQSTIEALDQSAFSTPATARILMAYIADLTLGMESLFLVLKPRQDKVVTVEDINKAYRTYYSSPILRAVHTAVRDYIGDEQVFKAFRRDKAAEKVATIIEANRFNMTNLFRTDT